jgi:hypothetical protein
MSCCMTVPPKYLPKRGASRVHAVLRVVLPGIACLLTWLGGMPTAMAQTVLCDQTTAGPINCPAIPAGVTRIQVTIAGARGGMGEDCVNPGSSSTTLLPPPRYAHPRGPMRIPGAAWAAVAWGGLPGVTQGV